MRYKLPYRQQLVVPVPEVVRHLAEVHLLVVAAENRQVVVEHHRILAVGSSQ